MKYARKMNHMRSTAIAVCTIVSPAIALAAETPTKPPVNFTNSTDVTVGTQIPNLFSSFSNLMVNYPAVMIQNYQTVINMTANLTSNQTLQAIHDDRTGNQYSVMNGLGPLTSIVLTGAGASITGVTPDSLTPTFYAPYTYQDYVNNINYGTPATWGATTFGNGTATPLASAVNFVNNVARANSSTEPSKKTFNRAQVAGSPFNPLDAIYNNYSVTTNPTGLTTADTKFMVVPGYLSHFGAPAPYANTPEWVQGVTVIQAMIDANGGKPLTAGNFGTYTNGVFTPATFGVGAYIPGIGTAPRP
jgi:hypothetical protein